MANRRPECKFLGVETLSDLGLLQPTQKEKLGGKREDV